MILAPFDGLRAAYDNLNDRERKLVSALGGIMVLVVVALPFWLINDSILEIEEENGDIHEVLREISHERANIAQRQAELAAAQRRYDRPAPPLGGFLEGRATEAGYTDPLQVNDQPDKVGDLFTRRHLRASLPNVGLRTAIDLLASIENSAFPVAVEQVHLDHTVMGQDRFNMQVGVFAFDRNGGDDDDDDDDGPTKRSGGRTGPPAP